MLRPHLRTTIPALLSIALAAACSGGGPEPGGGGAGAEREPASAPDAPSGGGPQRERAPIDASTVGSVHGTVRITGDVPERNVLSIEGKGCPHHDTPPLNETVIANDGKLENVFVTVRHGLEGWQIPPPPDEEVVLDQVGCIYTPHVSALQAGQTLRVHNGDPTNHNVHLTAPRNNASGNRMQPVGSPDLEIPLERRELKIFFKCDIHPWMRAWVHVEDHPFFAISGADGGFAIDGLPPGEYELEALHELYGTQRAKVTVPPAGTAEVEFVYEAD